MADLPVVIGHRGAAAHAPENTLASIRSAAALGASWVEFDVKLTADGRCIVFHDDALDRTTDGRGAVSTATHDEINRLDAGAWFAPAFAGERVPSLAAALGLIIGLRLGADDYLTKDISLSHLIARIVALLRRVDALSESGAHDNRLERGDLSVNLDTMAVLWQGQTVDLTVTEFWLIHALARHPGHVKNRDQLMQAANAVLDDNTITSHVKRIRKKFVDVDTDFHAIETVYGMGYRWKTD